MKAGMPNLTTDIDASSIKVGIITAQWNPEITYSLRDGVIGRLKELNASDSNIIQHEVDGSFELPLAAQHLIETHKVDVVIPIGCLVKGSTMHFEYISEAVSQGLMNVGLTTKIPVLFGVLTCLTEEQARDRAIGPGNHGPSWAETAVKLALSYQSK